MAKQRGLGRGLDALFEDNSVETGQEVSKLGIFKIEANQNQPRTNFDEESLAELAESIAEHGVLQPILVRQLPGGGYRIVAGERRWRAARQAGLTEIPAVVRQMTDKEEAAASLVENLQRKDLNPIEEAAGYKRLGDEYGLTQEEIAKTVSKSRPAVANALRLLSLPQKVIDMLQQHQLTAGHARALLSLENKENIEAVAQLMVEKQMSVREAEMYCKKCNTAPKQPKVAQLPVFVREVELSLAESLGRKVKVRGTKKHGTLEIEYFNEEDLRKLAKMLDGQFE